MSALRLGWRTVRRYCIYKGIVALRTLMVKRGYLK